MSSKPWIDFLANLKFCCKTPETSEILSRSVTQETMLLQLSSICEHKQHQNAKKQKLRKYCVKISERFLKLVGFVEK